MVFEPFSAQFLWRFGSKGGPKPSIFVHFSDFWDSSLTLFDAILMEVRLQRDPKPSIFVDFSDFGGFLSIPTLTKITKITVLEQLL